MLVRGRHRTILDAGSDGATAARSIHAQLHPAAALFHAYCMDPIELRIARLKYEPRAICACHLCAAIWIGTKSGQILGIGLHHGGDGEPVQTPMQLPTLSTASAAPRRSGIRALLHVHRPDDADAGRVVLVGTDTGHLSVLTERAGGASWSQPIHLEALWEARPQRRTSVPLDRGFDATSEMLVGRRRYTVGVTAMALLSDRSSPSDLDLDLLVTTRQPSAFLVRIQAGQLTLVDRHPVAGWVQWIYQSSIEQWVDAGTGRRRAVTCVSRGGDVTTFVLTESDRGREWSFEAQAAPRLAPALPTAAHPWVTPSGLLLGTKDGLYLLQHDARGGVGGEGAAGRCQARLLPAVRTPILTITRIWLHDRYYFALGLDDGRVLLMEEQALDVAPGGANPGGFKRFPLKLPDAVLAAEAVVAREADRCVPFLLVALRNHELHLFRVENQQELSERVHARWEAHWGKKHAWEVARLEESVASVTVDPPTRAARSVPWCHLLAGVILPELAKRDGVLTRENLAHLYECLCRLAEARDAKVAITITTWLREEGPRIGRLPHFDPADVIRVSMALLRETPRRPASRWRAFVQRHLHDLHALALAVEGDHRDHTSRLVAAWSRFVCKYLLGGDTFMQKTLCLEDLVRYNDETGKSLDALIYLARLYHRRYDLRWEARVDGEVFALHPLAGACVVVTTDGRITFLDDDGHPVVIQPDRGARGLSADRRFLQPDADKERHLRTLSSVATEAQGVVTVALSWISTFRSHAHEPECGVTIFQAVRTAGRAWRVTATPVLAADGERTRTQAVYSLCRLDGRRDALLAGMDATREPLGVIALENSRWRLRALDLHNEAHTGLDADRATLAPGKVPVRALASCPFAGAETGHYLVALGSDDGTARLVRMALPAGTRAAIEVLQTDRYVYPVTAIVVAKIDGDDHHSWYVGTAGGELYAFSAHVTARGLGPQVTDDDTGGGDRQPVWRDTFDGALVRFALARLPLYPGAPGAPPCQVLLAVTDQGRLSLYETRRRPTSLPDPERAISESNNFFFRGLRYDRISLEGQSIAFALSDDGGEFVSASGGGRVVRGSILYTRNSAGRVPGDGTGRTLWDRLRRIYEDVHQHEVFYPSPDDERRRELCELVDIEDGALRRYLLRAQIYDRSDWQEVEDGSIRGRIKALLSGLRPEECADRERIKVVIKAAARRLVDRPLRDLLDEVRRGVVDAGARAGTHARVEAAFMAIFEYVSQDLHESRDTSRLQITAFSELFRVNLLLHVARERSAQRTDAGAGPLEAALVRWTGLCLHDDYRLVRVEALRAIAIALRNVIVLDAAARRANGGSFAARVFPGGLASLQWLVDIILLVLKRYPRILKHPVQTTAWYCLSALVPIFRIFPDQALLLCAQIAGAGLDLDVLEVLACRLRSDAREVVAVRRRIDLYRIPSLRGDNARDRFIEHYDAKAFSERLRGLAAIDLEARPPREDGRIEVDHDLAPHLREHYHALAQLWAASPGELQTVCERLAQTAPAMPPKTDLATLDDALAALSKALRELTEQGRRLPPPLSRPQATDAIKKIDGARAALEALRLVEPARTIALNIVDWWRSLFDTRVHRKGDRIKIMGDELTLGELIESGGFANVYLLERPNGVDLRWVLKAFRHPYSEEKRIRFVAGIKANIALKDVPNVVQVYWATSDTDPLPACVMERCSEGDLASFIREQQRQNPGATGWRHEATRALAATLTETIRRAHELGYVHGDIHPKNILVDRSSDGLVFKLSDFDLAVAAADRGSAASEQGSTPLASGPLHSGLLALSDGADRARWTDWAAFAVVLYEILTGEKLHVASEQGNKLRVACTKLEELRSRLPGGDSLVHVVTALATVFDAAAGGAAALGLNTEEFHALLAGRAHTRRASIPPPAPPTRPCAFVWYSLANLGFGGAPTEARREALRRILRDIERSEWKRPDVIFIAGDLALNGDGIGYQMAEDWLKKLAATVDASPERIRLVAGDRDVNRDAPDDIVVRALQQMVERAPPELDRVLADAGSCGKLREIRGPYCELAKRFASGNRIKGPGVESGLDWHELLDAVPGRPGAIRLVGLCAPWLPVAGGGVYLAPSQFAQTLGSLPPESPQECQEAVVVAAHTRPEEWDPQSQSAFRNFLGDRKLLAVVAPHRRHSPDPSMVDYCYHVGALRWNPQRGRWETTEVCRSVSAGRDAGDFRESDWVETELRWPPVSAPIEDLARALEGRFDELRAVLAQLYRGESSARRVASDVRLGESGIDFSGADAVRWHNVIRAAIDHNKLVDLFALVWCEYPTNRELAQLAGMRPLPNRGGDLVARLRELDEQTLASVLQQRSVAASAPAAASSAVQILALVRQHLTHEAEIDRWLDLLRNLQR